MSKLGEFNEALFDAVVTNDLDGVRRALDGGADPSFADPRYGWQMLYWAADKGYAHVAAKLLHEGARPDACGFERETALHPAARWGNTGTACILLGFGADVNAADERGRTPLYRAVQYGRTRCALLFLLSGADTCAEDIWGRLPSDPRRRGKYEHRVSRAIEIVNEWEQEGTHDLSILEPELAGFLREPPTDEKEKALRLISIGCRITPELLVQPLRASLKYHEYAEHRRRAEREKALLISELATQANVIEL